MKGADLGVVLADISGGNRSIIERTSVTSTANTGLIGFFFFFFSFLQTHLSFVFSFPTTAKDTVVSSRQVAAPGHGKDWQRARRILDSGWLRGMHSHHQGWFGGSFFIAELPGMVRFVFMIWGWIMEGDGIHDRGWGESG